MVSNWAIPRDRVIDVAIAGLRRGWSKNVRDACEGLTRCHYQGVSPKRALGLLVRDVMILYYEQYGGRNEAQQEICEMAQALRNEGWSFVPAFGQNSGGLWRHRQLGIDVNQCGGYFKSFAEATLRTFESQTRKLIQSRAYNELERKYIGGMQWVEPERV